MLLNLEKCSSGPSSLNPPPICGGLPANPAFAPVQRWELSVRDPNRPDRLLTTTHPRPGHRASVLFCPHLSSGHKSANFSELQCHSETTLNGNKPMERCDTALTIKEMQRKITTWNQVRQKGTLSLAWGAAWHSPVQTLVVPARAQSTWTQQAHAFPRGVRARSHPKTGQNVIAALFTTDDSWKQPKCPSSAG